MSGALVEGPHVDAVHERNGKLVRTHAVLRGLTDTEAAFDLEAQGRLEYGGDHTAAWAIWCATDLDARP